MNRVTELFGIKYPIIQGGMVWCSGWELASAVSNAGGLGLIGAGSMSPEMLRAHILKCKEATDKPFGVNVPLLFSHLQETMKVIVDEDVKIVFTSGGKPDLWTSFLKDKGIKVAHVVPGAKYAAKCEAAGVDAVVAEGFEAGGHNGREETTTLCLIPKVRETIKIPLIAAGGITGGRAMLAVMVLGAEGVQMGTRFVASWECSASAGFKQKVVECEEGGTVLALKKLAPVRLLRNKFCAEVLELESRGATPEELTQLLGKGRAGKGMFEGDVENGELEIGQAASLLKGILPAGEIVDAIWNEFLQARKEISEAAAQLGS
ncbi:MAG: nitronate monooxygenase [Elusimicrobiales bacterium]|nr:nitronate monooxygenase [Elusimicrobiales bacterium]